MLLHWRTRGAYAIAAAVVLLTGLVWRSRRLPLSPFLAKYGGDALWAALVYFLFRIAAPHVSAIVTALAALTFSVLIEFSQLYHAPWIDAIRGTRLGALILGSTFNWPDIPAYAAGVVLAFGLDVVGHRRVRVCP